MNLDPTQRFSSRVEDYIRFRPSYPADLISYLARACGLGSASSIADAGSGTGIFSGLLLTLGCEVFGVEPNADMRHAGEQTLRSSPRYHSVDGRAEATTLPDRSIDLVTAAQAFHWFDLAAARTEFRRILKPPGWVALIWNERLVREGFLDGYEKLLREFAPDYTRVDHRRIDANAISSFFGHSAWHSETFANCQDLDWEGLRGRLLSSSYVPLPGSPAFAPMMREFARLFSLYQQDGLVQVLYETKLYLGQLAVEAREHEPSVGD